MASKLSIAKDLRPILDSDNSLNLLVGTNVFPLFAPEDTRGDFVIYARTDYWCRKTLMGNVDEGCEITYNAVSDKYKKSVEIAERLRSILIDVRIDGDSLNLVRSSEEYVGVGNTLKYVQILVFGVGDKPD